MATAAIPHTAPDFPFESEVRFAVVIYGGVSLAIYINGVAQELLGMVRATTSRIPDSKLTNVETVYRELACGIGRSTVVEHRDRHNEPSKVGLIQPTADAAIAHAQASETLPRTRFVVDILTGTSAGGINAIYLAKALAHGTTLDALARMWITEADLTKLLNDGDITPAYLRQSRTPPSLFKSQPTSSLLNSRWMYLQLLCALERMNDETAYGPLVDDLDLYCTTTDLLGVPISLPLTDKTVREFRYKGDFHFKRRPNSQHTIDDFDESMDPFFAFVARCTSSFPVAFEPMMLDDILPTLQRDGRFRDDLNESPTPAIFGQTSRVGGLPAVAAFQKSCPIYSTCDAANVPFPQRPFADGGYLQNKPFSYAIEILKTRSADLPVDRKLIYVEPEPDSIPDSPDPDPHRPDAIQNMLAALTVLPRYQAIQQDIQNVIEWNSNIARLQDVLHDLGFDQVPGEPSPPPLETPDPRSLAHRAYLRLRRSGAADQLACRIATAMNVEINSAHGTAIRLTVGKWRDQTFPPAAAQTAEPGLRTTDDLLALFDFDFVGRAIRFLRTLLQDPEHLEKDQANTDQRLRRVAKLTRDLTDLINDDPGFFLPDLNPLAYPSWLACLSFLVDPHAALQVLPAATDSSANLLLSATDAGCAHRVDFLFANPDYPFAFILNPQIARQILPPTRRDPRDPIFDSGPAGAARRLELWQKEGSELAALLDPFSFRAILAFMESRLFKNYGDSASSSRLGVILEHLRNEIFAVLPNSWERFLQQDTVVYPIVFGTNLGEFQTVDIFRISPEDTAVLTSSATPASAGPAANPKLKGDSLEAFGGFLDRSWRLNDMLRGRLDAAERLITAVLPDSDPHTTTYREHYIRLAQEAIARDWVAFQNTIPDVPRMLQEDRDHAHAPAQ